MGARADGSERLQVAGRYVIEIWFASMAASIFYDDRKGFDAIRWEMEASAYVLDSLQKER